jgi:protein phosphatase
MGTTVTAAYVSADEVTIAHVGDSRAYLLRDGDLIRLTRDHSLVGELVARGKLTEEQAEAHPQRSVITRSVGPEPEVQVDTHVYQARAGDCFMVCSDGLTSMITDAHVKEIIEGSGSLGEAGRELIAAANEAGGRDNITVVLFRLEEVNAPSGDDQPTQVGSDAPSAAEVKEAAATAAPAAAPPAARTLTVRLTATRCTEPSLDEREPREHDAERTEAGGHNDDQKGEDGQPPLPIRQFHVCVVPPSSARRTSVLLDRLVSYRSERPAT